jgi:hypothetical protein
MKWDIILSRLMICFGVLGAVALMVAMVMSLWF